MKLQQVTLLPTFHSRESTEVTM